MTPHVWSPCGQDGVCISRAEGCYSRSFWVKLFCMSLAQSPAKRYCTLQDLKGCCKSVCIYIYPLTLFLSSFSLCASLSLPLCLCLGVSNFDSGTIKACVTKLPAGIGLCLNWVTVVFSLTYFPCYFRFRFPRFLHILALKSHETSTLASLHFLCFTPPCPPASCLCPVFSLLKWTDGIS